MKQIFIVKIRIDNDCWHYKKDDIILIPVLSNNINNAENKVLNKYNGSEYPLYTLLQPIKTDNFLFKPII